MSFSTTSRYASIATATLDIPGGQSVAYLRRRFIPQPERFALLQEHVVVQGDRVDLVASRFLGDPEQFWRLCDANGVMHPAELTATGGRRLRITLPEGLTSTSHA